MTITFRYKVSLSYVCFISKSRKVATFGWSVKEYGKPSLENLIKFRAGLNASLEAGQANEHFKETQSYYGTATIQETRTNNVVVMFKPPMFEIV